MLVGFLGELNQIAQTVRAGEQELHTFPGCINIWIVDAVGVIVLELEAVNRALDIVAKDQLQADEYFVLPTRACLCGWILEQDKRREHARVVHDRTRVRRPNEIVSIDVVRTRDAGKLAEVRRVVRDRGNIRRIHIRICGVVASLANRITPVMNVVLADAGIGVCFDNDLQPLLLNGTIFPRK